MSDLLLGPPDAISPDHMGDFDEWAAEWAFAMSGTPYDLGEPGGNPICGVWISPPDGDPFLYIRNRRAWKSEEDVLPARVLGVWYILSRLHPSIFTTFRSLHGSKF